MNKYVLTILLLLLPLISVGAEDWVPPGFENLNEPQTTAVDVYYGGYFLTSTMARFDNNWFTFNQPETLTNRITDLLDPESAELLLSEELPLNQQQLCHSEFQLDCGTLQPDLIAIIFDRANLRAWLFVNPELLKTRQAQEYRYLPKSSASWSLFSDNSLFFSETSAAESSYNLANTTQLAVAENRLLIRSNLTDADGFTLDTLSLSREYAGKEFAAGLFRGDSNNLRFFDSEQFVGIAVQSSVETRADLEQFQGNSIELFLETRSRVEIYFDSRLYSTDYYDVGNQVLDTSSLPPGSYDIEIRITDAAGNTRIENRYFAKNSQLAPIDQDLFFLQAGRQLELQDFSGLEAGEEGADFLRLGYSKRLSASIGGDLGLSVTPDSSMLEAGLFKQGSNYQFHAGLAYESTGAVGLTSDLRIRAERFTMNFNARQILSQEYSSQLSEAISQYSASLEMPSQLGPVSFFYRQNSRGDAFEGRNYGMRWRSTAFDLGSGNMTASFEISRNNEDLFAALSLDYRFYQGASSHAISPSLRYESSDANGSNTDFRGTVESNWHRSKDQRLSLRADHNSRSSVQASLESGGRLGSADITAGYNFDNNSPEVFGRLKSRFATTGGSSAIGGDRSGESALLIKVDGVAGTHRFKVLVNGSPRGELNGGQTLLVPVAPFETYDISLETVSNSLIDLDARSYRKTVYPGNVVDVSWQAREVVIAYGRLLDATGNPIVNALLENVIGLATSDANGYFQAELDRGTDSLLVRKDDRTCTVKLSAEANERGLLPLGELACMIHVSPQTLEYRAGGD